MQGGSSNGSGCSRRLCLFIFNMIFIHVFFPIDVRAALLLKKAKLHMRQLPHLYSCDPYSCSASLTPSAAFLMKWHFFLKIHNYHAVSTGMDWLHPCNSLSPISLKGKCKIMVAPLQGRKRGPCWCTIFYTVKTSSRCTVVSPPSPQFSNIKGSVPWEKKQ